MLAQPFAVKLSVCVIWHLPDPNNFVRHHVRWQLLLCKGKDICLSSSPLHRVRSAYPAWRHTGKRTPPALRRRIPPPQSRPARCGSHMFDLKILTGSKAKLASVIIKCKISGSVNRLQITVIQRILHKCLLGLLRITVISKSQSASCHTDLAFTPFSVTR